MRRSARELGLPLDPADLPDDRAVARLIAEAGSDGLAGRRRPAADHALGWPGDARDTAAIARLWMTAGPLPPPTRSGGARIAAVDPRGPG